MTRSDPLISPPSPNIPYDYATQLRAIASWAAADDRLGVDFLRAVLHDTPSGLLIPAQ